MGADNILEWEVVTADGEHLTASPRVNPDLYWALSGGGPGVFGVVTGATIKVHKDGPIVGTTLSFMEASSPNPDAFWKGIGAFLRLQPEFHEKGVSVQATMPPGMFFIQPLLWLDKGKDEIEELIAPLLEELQNLAINYTMATTEFPTWYELFSQYYGPMPYGIWEHAVTLASRLILRKDLEQRHSTLVDALRFASSQGFSTAMNGFRVPSRFPNYPNAVLPAWRQSDLEIFTFSQWTYSAPYEENIQRETKIIENVYPRFKQISPTAGSYLNEANAKQADWQEAFYGANYGKLLKVKKRYDRQGLFYTRTGVGSEDWTEDAATGKLCQIDRHGSEL